MMLRFGIKSNRMMKEYMAIEIYNILDIFVQDERNDI